MSYITPAGRVNLTRYAYKGEDRSLLYKYVLSPWAQFCVDHLTPPTLAPNTITAIGLLLQVAAYLVLFSQSPTFDSDVSQGAAAFAAFCLFAYSTLDNMDGKQARKIGASSPLGLLFDHGCDSINTGMVGSLVFGMVTKAGGGSWKLYTLWGAAMTAFFMNTWEEFHIREFILPIVNGPSEGLIMMVCLLGATAAYGPAIWSGAIPGYLKWFEGMVSPVTAFFKSVAGDTSSDITNLDLVVSGSAFFLILTCVVNIYNVVRYMYRHHEQRKLYEGVRAVVRTTPLWLLHIICGCWFHYKILENQIDTHPHIFYLTAGALSSDFTSKLMVSHVTDQKFRPDYRSMAVFAGGPIVQFLKGFGFSFIGPLAFLDSGTFWLYISFVVATTHLTTFLYFSITDIAATLDIGVFDATKQIARAQARKAAEVARK